MYKTNTTHTGSERNLSQILYVKEEEEVRKR